MPHELDPTSICLHWRAEAKGQAQAAEAVAEVVVVVVRGAPAHVTEYLLVGNFAQHPSC
jgi:hypothetical protein